MKQELTVEHSLCLAFRLMVTVNKTLELEMWRFFVQITNKSTFPWEALFIHYQLEQW